MADLPAAVPFPHEIFQKPSFGCSGIFPGKGAGMIWDFLLVVGGLICLAVLLGWVRKWLAGMMQ